MQEKLEAVDYRNPPYSLRYPELVGILEDEPAQPKGNVVERNLSVGGKWMDLQGVEPGLVVERDNITEGSLDYFVDAAAMDFRLKEDCPAWEKGFEEIPFRQDRAL